MQFIAIHCTLAVIQDDLVRAFSATKFRHSKNWVTDIFAVDERKEIFTTEHNRAKEQPKKM